MSWLKKIMNTSYCTNERVCKIILINPESGKEICTFDGIPEINLTRNRVEKCYDCKGCISTITKDESVLSFSVDTSKINPEVLGIDTSKTPDQFSIFLKEKVKTRKHHKKRINKKWFKRYGYKEQQNVDLGKWNYKETGVPGEYEFERKVI